LTTTHIYKQKVHRAFKYKQ